MNEWMFYWPDIWKFQCWKEERLEVGSAWMEEGEAEREVSYSVSSDLQVTLKMPHDFLKTLF